MELESSGNRVIRKSGDPETGCLWCY